MADFKGSTCIACRTIFEAGDDIVVCPECGTPYHRDCWKAHGKCINEELHESGGVWQPDTAESEDLHLNMNENQRQTVTCVNCGAENEESNIFCVRCGKNIRHKSRHADDQQDDAEGRTGFFSSMVMNDTMDEEYYRSPDAEMGGERVSDINSFVGTNQAYYLPRFRYFHEQLKKFAPSFVAFLVPELYFAYRKMWKWSIITIVLLLLLDFPALLATFVDQSDSMIEMIQNQFSGMGGLYEDVTRQMSENLAQFAEMMRDYGDILYWFQLVCNYLSLVVHILGFIFANYLYYRHTCKSIRAIHEDESSLMDLQSRLRMKGGTSIGLLIGLFCGKYVLKFVVTGVMITAVMM